MNGNLRNRVNRCGCCLAGAYVLILLAVFAYTAATTAPSNVGLDWIPFGMLAMPWYGLDAHLLFPGFIANTAFMYLLGTVLQRFWRSVKEWG